MADFNFYGAGEKNENDNPFYERVQAYKQFEDEIKEFFNITGIHRKCEDIKHNSRFKCCWDCCPGCQQECTEPSPVIDDPSV